MEHEIVARVRGRVNSELNERKDRATQSIDDVANLVHRVGQPLHEKPLTPIGKYVDVAAERLHEIAGGLRDRTVQELTEDVRRFARKRPVAFAGAGVAVGLVAARFLRSSAGDRTPTRRRASTIARHAAGNAERRKR